MKRRSVSNFTGLGRLLGAKIFLTSVAFGVFLSQGSAQDKSSVVQYLDLKTSKVRFELETAGFVIGGVLNGINAKLELDSTTQEPRKVSASADLSNVNLDDQSAPYQMVFRGFVNSIGGGKVFFVSDEIRKLNNGQIKVFGRAKRGQKAEAITFLCQPIELNIQRTRLKGRLSDDHLNLASVPQFSESLFGFGSLVGKGTLSYDLNFFR